MTMHLKRLHIFGTGWGFKLGTRAPTFSLCVDNRLAVVKADSISAEIQRHAENSDLKPLYRLLQWHMTMPKKFLRIQRGEGG